MTATIAIAAVSGAIFAIAALVAVLSVQISSAVRKIAIGLAAGILMSVAVVELFPEAIESAGHEAAATGFLIGFMVLFLVETLTRGHVHHHHDQGDDDHVHEHPVLPFVIGLSVHNIADGFAIGGSHEVSHNAADAVAVGIMVHQLPVGISVAAVLATAAVTRQLQIKLVIAMGALIPIAAVSTALLSLGERGEGIVGAAAAGALLYISAGHLLPEAQSESRPMAAALIFPAAAAATAMLFLVVLPGH